MKIIIVQSIIEALGQIKNALEKLVPDQMSEFVFSSNFEESLSLVPKNEDVVVITSWMFHDDVDIKFTNKEKTGDKFAQLVKEDINPQARVYLFSSYPPDSMRYFDGFYKKVNNGYRDDEEIVEILFILHLIK